VAEFERCSGVTLSDRFPDGFAGSAGDNWLYAIRTGGVVSQCTETQLLGYVPGEDEVTAHRQFSLPFVSYAFGTKRSELWGLVGSGGVAPFVRSVQNFCTKVSLVRELCTKGSAPCKYRRWCVLVNQRVERDVHRTESDSSCRRTICAGHDMCSRRLFACCRRTLPA
jgi:hypothetical protein